MAMPPACSTFSRKLVDDQIDPAGNVQNLKENRREYFEIGSNLSPSSVVLFPLGGRWCGNSSSFSRFRPRSPYPATERARRWILFPVSAYVEWNCPSEIPSLQGKIREKNSNKSKIIVQTEDFSESFSSWSSLQPLSFPPIITRSTAAIDRNWYLAEFEAV